MTSWERFAAASGWIAGLVFLVAALAGGLPPGPDTPPDAVARFLAAHRSALLWQAILFEIAILLLICFFAWLCRVLARVEGGVAPLSLAGFGGFLLLIATANAGLTPQTAMVWRGAERFSPELVRLVYDVNMLALYPLTSMLSLLSILAPSIVAWRAGLLPSWLYVVIGALGAANIAELAGLRFETGFLAAGAGPGLVAPPVWALWVAGASWHLWRRGPTLEIDSPR